MIKKKHFRAHIAHSYYYVTEGNKLFQVYLDFFLNKTAIDWPNDWIILLLQKKLLNRYITNLLRYIPRLDVGLMAKLTFFLICKSSLKLYFSCRKISKEFKSEVKNTFLWPFHSPMEISKNHIFLENSNFKMRLYFFFQNMFLFSKKNKNMNISN